MAQLLWVTADYFEPVDNGRRRYSAGISAGLAELGHTIHFVGRQRSTDTRVGPRRLDPVARLAEPGPCARS